MISPDLSTQIQPQSGPADRDEIDLSAQAAAAHCAHRLCASSCRPDAGTHLSFNPKDDHFAFGWETGRIARSITLGKGFSSPMQGDTGPTAWIPPLYPYFLAGLFKLFGVYSNAAAWVTLAVNSVFSALTCVT